MKRKCWYGIEHQQEICITYETFIIVEVFFVRPSSIRRILMRRSLGLAQMLEDLSEVHSTKFLPYARLFGLFRLLFDGGNWCQ